ncbi:MAG: hypothetical protein VXW65_07895 [Pseudomonadota bacterium]|nr:hypothetical protein [Pseudomonadota bacterium]
MSRSAFYKQVRDYALHPPLGANPIRHDVMPDEQHDLLRVSYRVYGTFNEALTIAAAAGLSSTSGPLTEQVLVLPSAAELREIKRESGHVG